MLLLHLVFVCVVWLHMKKLCSKKKKKDLIPRILTIPTKSPSLNYHRGEMTWVGADLGRWRAAASSSSSPPLMHGSPAQPWVLTGRDGTPPSPGAAAPVPPVTTCRTKTLSLHRQSLSRTRRPPTPGSNETAGEIRRTQGMDNHWDKLFNVNFKGHTRDVRWKGNISSYQLFWHRVSVQDQWVGWRRRRDLGYRGTTLLQTLCITCRDGVDWR